MKSTLIIIGSTLAFGSLMVYGVEAAKPNLVINEMQNKLSEVYGESAYDSGEVAIKEAIYFAEMLERFVTYNKSSDNMPEIDKKRLALKKQFDVSYQAIIKSESDGDLAEASLARATIQEMISYYFAEDKNDNEISTDIMLYSEVLTESLIELRTNEFD